MKAIATMSFLESSKTLGFVSSLCAGTAIYSALHGEAIIASVNGALAVNTGLIAIRYAMREVTEKTEPQKPEPAAATTNSTPAPR